MPAVVMYLPPKGFTAREIHRESWKAIGCPDDTKRWSKANRMRIPVSEFSPEALEYIKTDDSLEIVDEDDGSEVLVEASRSNGGGQDSGG